MGSEVSIPQLQEFSETNCLTFSLKVPRLPLFSILGVRAEREKNYPLHIVP